MASRNEARWIVGVIVAIVLLNLGMWTLAMPGGLPGS